VDDYRRIRSELERGVLPLATSVDGRQFTFQASLHQLQLQTGGYVVLEDEGGDRRLGQILTMRPDSALAPDLGIEGLNSSMLTHASARFACGQSWCAQLGRLESGPRKVTCGRAAGADFSLPGR